MTELLALHTLRKHFGRRTLFEIEQLSLESSMVYVLTGDNGAGKTTLLRILCGLEHAEVGSVFFIGERCNLAPYPKAMRAAVIYVHQHPAMFSVSVEDNISYGLVVRGWKKSDIKQHVDDAMKWAGISHLRKMRTRNLSGGEKQRIALARAKVLSPKLLLLDEPTANLDSQAKERVIALIPSLIQSGSTVLIACHDQDLIRLPGAKRMHLQDGKLLFPANEMNRN